MQFVYWTSIIGIAILAMLVNNKKISEEKAFFIISFFLIFMSAFRNTGGIGGDEYNYRLGSLQYIGKELNLSYVFAAEGGNYLVQWGLANLFKYTQPYIVFSAIIANVLILTTIKKYSKYALFSVFLYVVSGTYIASMNISRQYIAVGIVFFAYRFIQNRRFWMFVLCVILAVWFHTSALIMIPMYFVLNKEKVSKWSILWFAIAILVMVNFEHIVGSFIMNTKYDEYATMLTGNNSMNPIRMLKDLLPGLAILLLRKKIDRINENYGFLYDTMLLTVLISIVSVGFKYTYRFTCYFTLGMYVLLPQLINVVDRRTKPIITVGLIVMFVLFGYIDTGHGVEYHNVLFEQLPYGTSYGAKYIR